jgi:dTDP-4-dehydrorhamnose reductase
MKIAIVGAGGLVGSEFRRQLASEHEVTPFSHAEFDVTDRESTARKIFELRPHLIINCAVAGVDDCEREPELARAVNSRGPENLAKVAATIDAAMVHFSSNYVFDGERKDGPYTIDDLPHPLSVYGRTKLEGEDAVRTLTDRHFIVRTSWVFGPGKKNFLSTVPQSILSGDEIRVISDVAASATYLCDLVERSLEIVSRGKYGTYHVVNSGLCSYLEFVQEAARLLGLNAKIKPVTLRELQLPAARPYYSPMSCKQSEVLGFAPMRSWQAALADFILTNRREP